MQESEAAHSASSGGVSGSVVSCVGLACGPRVLASDRRVAKSRSELAGRLERRGGAAAYTAVLVTGRDLLTGSTIKIY